MVFGYIDVLGARNLLIRSFCDRQLPAVPDRQHTEPKAERQPDYRDRQDWQTHKVTAHHDGRSRQRGNGIELRT